ncbi:MAG: ornithine decarboxylase, partial [Pseudomonadota bacterium]
QYGLIASLDIARKQMSMEGHSCLARCFAFADQLRSGIDASGVFRVLSLEDMIPPGLEDDRVRLDPSKLTIDVSQSAMSASQIQRELYSRHSIQLEKTTHNTLSVLVTIGTTQSKVLRLTNALTELANDASRCQPAIAGEHIETPLLPPPGLMRELPRQAYFADSEYLPLNADSGAVNPELLGRVASDQVVPYPPGIPVLVPGQEVDEATLRFLRETAFGEQGIEIHGLLHREGRNFVRVTRKKDSSSRSNLHESTPLSASGA